MISLDDFINIWNGKGIDTDGYYGFQCMDLAHKYATDCVGKDFLPASSAKDVWNQNIDGYDKIANTPDGVPQKGDIIIWGEGVGPWGHIAVFVSGNADSFTSFDQNWPIGSLCHLQQHNYTGVLGWFHPKSILITEIVIDKATFEKLVTKSTEDDAYRALGFGSPEDVRVLVDNLQAMNADLVTNYNALRKQVLDLTEQLTICRNQPPSSPLPAPQVEDLKVQIRPLVNSGWITYLRSRTPIQKLVNV